ncbi:hypothetical protein BKA63DRAFT_508746 [Paraphoma chrysanthemicola]|nr:hypothetical protein BKA63DRAFT_508746 [Paraphoma chrysanthemicola]
MGPDEDARLVGLTEDHPSVIQRTARLAMLRDFVVGQDAFRRWLTPDLFTGSYKFKAFLAYGRDATSSLQKRMFASPQLINAIIDIGINHSGLDADGLPNFRHLTNALRAPIFAAGLTQPMIKMMFKPLQQAIDIPKVCEIQHWRVQYQAMYIAAAETMWSTTDWLKYEYLGETHFDRYLLYENIRGAVLTFDDHLDVSEIPTSNTVWSNTVHRCDPTFETANINQAVNEKAWGRRIC